MNAIIVGPNGRPSIKELINTFDFDSEVNVFTYLTNKKTKKRFWRKYRKNNEIIKLLNPPTFGIGDTVIFWGTRIQINVTGAIVYNHPHKIDHASNKKKSRQILIENNVPTPALLDKNDLHNAVYPVIVRKDRHRGGIGFHICQNRAAALDAVSSIQSTGSDYYISEVYPKTEEYRVHCASGKALLVKRKPEPNDKKIIAWNFCQNELPWTTIERKNYDHNMITTALDAVKALGLDFGAVDIMSKPSVNGFAPHVVVEVNTAPSYTPYLISKYGKYFNLLFNQSDKISPWEYTKFTKGSSLSWKNVQLKNGITNE